MINEIWTNFLRVDMTIKDTSRGLLVSSNSPKKQTNEFIITTTMKSFVLFWENSKKSFRNYLTFSKNLHLLAVEHYAPKVRTC